MRAVDNTPDPTPSERSRILIVDDDDGIRGLVSSFLGKHGFSVDTAADAQEVLLGRRG